MLGNSRDAILAHRLATVGDYTLRVCVIQLHLFFGLFFFSFNLDKLQFIRLIAADRSRDYEIRETDGSERIYSEQPFGELRVVSI